MAVIRFFATNGHRQTKSSAPIDYLLGIYSALTPQQKNERSTIADAIRVARDKNDAPLVHRLNQQLRLIHGVPGIQIISATLMDEWREVANC